MFGENRCSCWFGNGIAVMLLLLTVSLSSQAAGHRWLAQVVHYLLVLRTADHPLTGWKKYVYGRQRRQRLKGESTSVVVIIICCIFVVVIDLEVLPLSCAAAYLSICTLLSVSVLALLSSLIWADKRKVALSSDLSWQYLWREQPKQFEDLKERDKERRIGRKDNCPKQKITRSF